MSERYRRSPHALYRNAGPDVLILLEAAETLTTLTGAAAVVWDALEEPADADSVKAYVASVLETHQAEVADGLASCLGDIVAIGALELEREGSS